MPDTRHMRNMCRIFLNISFESMILFSDGSRKKPEVIKNTGTPIFEAAFWHAPISPGKGKWISTTAMQAIAFRQSKLLYLIFVLLNQTAPF